MCQSFFKLLFQHLQQPLRNRRKNLIFLPYQINIRFKLRRKGTEHKPAVRVCVNQMLKRQKIAKPLFHKKRSVIGQTKRSLKMQPLNIMTAPFCNIVIPALFRAEQRKSNQIIETDPPFFANGQSAGIITPHKSASGNFKEWYFAVFGSCTSTAKSMTPLSNFSVTCSVSPLVIW